MNVKEFSRKFKIFIKQRYLISLQKQLPIDRELMENLREDESLDYEIELYDLLQNEFSSLSKNFQSIEDESFQMLFDNSNILQITGGLALGAAALKIFHDRANKYMGTMFYERVEDALKDSMVNMYQSASAVSINEIVSKLPAKYKDKASIYLSKLPIDKTLGNITNQYSSFLTTVYMDDLSAKLSTSANKILNKFENKLERILYFKDDFININNYSTPYLYMGASTIQNLARNRAIINVYERAKVTTVTFNNPADERSTDICLSLNQQQWQFSKIIDKIQEIDNMEIPSNDTEAKELLKEVHPFWKFDKNSAKAGKDSIYKLDRQGNKIYIPGSKFNYDDNAGRFKPNVSDDYVDNFIEMGVPYPPLHYLCRSWLTTANEIFTELINVL